MFCSISEKPFQPYRELEDYDAKLRKSSSSVGACASFIGTMRDINDSNEIESMLLEYYPEMTEKELIRIIKYASDKWNLVDAFLMHRVGRVYPNDTIVVVGTWSTHRAHAFEACRYIMETLKSKVPIWKKEQYLDEEHWVVKNTDGYTEKTF